MARTRSDLPRMQKQAPIRGPQPSAVAAASHATEKPSESRKPPMMRQYDLIERVRRYNPNTNEALLNRAYVYAMKAHGEQRRASGDPYFSHPIEVAAILTDLKLDDATIAAALLHDTIEDTEATRAEIDSLFGHDIGTSGRGPDQAQKTRSRHQRSKAGGKPPQAAAGDCRRRARAADQARRPAAQYAHARVHAAGSAPPRCRRDA